MLTFLLMSHDHDLTVQPNVTLTKFILPQFYKMSAEGSQKGEVVCLLCNEQLEEYSSLDTNLCQCLCRLFSLDNSKNLSFAREYYCSFCKERVQSIQGLYGELERLEEEIRIYQSQFIQSIRYRYSEGSGFRVRENDERRSLFADIIHGCDSELDDFDASGQSVFPGPEEDETVLIEPKVETMDINIFHGLQDFQTDSPAEPNLTQDPIGIQTNIKPPNNSLPVVKLVRVDPSEYFGERRSSRRTRRVNYKNFSLPSQEVEETEFLEPEVNNDPDIEGEVSAGGSDKDDSDQEFKVKVSKSPRSTPRAKRSRTKGQVHCPNCQKQFRSNNDLKYHLETHLPHSERSYKCDICKKGFPKASILLKHNKTHGRQPRPQSTALSIAGKNLECPEPDCSYKFQSRVGIRKHIRLNHSNSEHSETLKWVKGRESKVGPVHCPVCDKVFKSRNDLKYHAEVHKPDHERSHQCPICARGFPKASIRNRHMLRHDGDEEATASLPKTLCAECGAWVVHLEYHLKTHRQPPPPIFQCTLCPKICSSKRQLDYHELVHAGIKPFQCNSCQTAFRTRSMLIRHQTIHLGEKKFLCDFCGKTFRLKQNYMEHQHVHTRELPHRCNFCGRRFPSMDDLNGHRNEMHGGETKKKSTDTEEKSILS